MHQTLSFNNSELSEITNESAGELSDYLCSTALIAGQAFFN
jgi:hypothetical protein